ncbi:hypothetical protein QQ045_014929 [Rhodiola kirilowii]
MASTSSDTAITTSAALETSPSISPSPSVPQPVTAPVAQPVGSGDDEATSSERKTKKGRGKVKMMKMEKPSNLLVTFSKRKYGLFKKANEICTLCGAECAVVVFSPAGKVFSFGHPSVDTVVDQYLNGNLDPVPLGEPHIFFMEAGHHHQGANVEELSAELTDIKAGLEAAKKNGQSLEKRREERVANCWWERPVQEMDGDQLDTLKSAMLALREKVYGQARLRLNTSAGSSSSSGQYGAFQWFHQSHFNGAGASSSGPSFAGFPSWAKNHI